MYTISVQMFYVSDLYFIFIFIFYIHYTLTGTSILGLLLVDTIEKESYKQNRQKKL